MHLTREHQKQQQPVVTVMVITAAPSWRLLLASTLNTLTSVALAVTSVLHTVTSLTTSDLIRVYSTVQYSTVQYSTEQYSSYTQYWQPYSTSEIFSTQSCCSSSSLKESVSVLELSLSVSAITSGPP